MLKTLKSKLKTFKDFFKKEFQGLMQYKKTYFTALLMLVLIAFPLVGIVFCLIKAVEMVFE